VRFLTRYVDDREIPAIFRQADLCVLPYTEIDQSGVLATALAFGKPMLLSDAGGFPEVAAAGAAECVPAGDVAALGSALSSLVADEARLATLSAGAQRLAAGEWSWQRAAERHLDLYVRLIATG
jgi:glycosyltransferase involved in cell wall biosynthesis